MATNTTATATTHTGNGSTNNFAISFSFLANNEVDVTVAGVLKTLDTHYTISGSTVTFTSGNTPANGAAVKFQRDTNISTKKVDFQDGSVLTETDLDTNSDQVLFAQQEITDKLGGIEEGATGDQTAAEIRTLVESASDSNVFTDADHSKLNGIEANATQDQTISEIKSLIAGSPLDASHLAANSVDSSELVDGSVDTSHLSADCVTNAKIADDSIDSEHYVDGSIDTAHIGNSQVTTAKIADSNVTTAKIADDAVTAAKIADSTITQVQMATDSVSTDEISANAITTTELANAAVQTENIATDGVRTTNIQNGAVTTAKIADANVTTAKIANDAVTTGKIADNELKTLASMQSATASKLADSTALTSDIADLNQLDGMAKQTTITDDDTKFPTSGAVVDFVAAQIAPIGGLEVIANEDSFPTTQPSSGVVISISDIEGLIVNGSGVATNARTSGNGSDNVTINGFPSSLQSKTMAAGLGLMVSSTGSSQTYTYHKLLAKEADVEQLSNDINDFAARYRVGSSNPTSALDAGDLFFNTSTSKLLVYNATNSAWEEAQSIGNFFISTLSPAFDGSTQDFTITNAPANVQQIILSINGVIQKPNSGTSTPSEGFALSGSTVKLAAAPPSGSSYFAIVLGSTVNIGTPSNNTVSTDILQNGAVTTAKIVDDAITGDKIATNLDLPDNNKIRFGTGNDLEIFHTGVYSTLTNTTGGLLLGASEVSIRPANLTEFCARFIANGAVELYYDNTKRLETDASGVKLSNGRFYSAGTFAFIESSDTSTATLTLKKSASGADSIDYLQCRDSNNNIKLSISGSGDIDIQDNAKLLLGTSDDLEIFHNGTDSFIKDTGTGALKICSNLFRVNNAANDEAMIKAEEDAGVTLSFNGSTKFETVTNGISVTGNVLLPDSTDGNTGRFKAGAGADLQIYHDGTDSIIKNSEGDLFVRNHASGELKLQAKFGEASITCIPDGAVELYHNNVKRFMTKSNGNELFGYTSIEDTSGTALQVIHSSSGDTIGCIMRHGRGGLSGFSGKMISFRGNDNTEEGSIVIGTTNTAYNTSSDYRLKENEVAISDGITRLKTLKPYRFNFKKDPDVKVDGFFAHEVSPVVPVAVTGTKDQVDEDDNPVYQGIDQSKLVPLLTAALQEAVGKIEILETKVAALEAA